MNAATTHPEILNSNLRAATRGFTLIELLIVISILGVLAAVLLPRLLEARATAEETSTIATFQRLDTAIAKFVRDHGYQPTDDLRYVEKDIEVNWKTDNGINTGIESLLCMISQRQKDGTDFGDMAAFFSNTDQDQHGMKIPLLGRSERLELADAWHTPLVYFSRLNLEKPQRVILADGEGEVQVKAKRREDGEIYGSGKYQLLSAGKDRTFGTDDDLVWPRN